MKQHGEAGTAPKRHSPALKEGMTFVDVGCGDGYFSILAAKKVGPDGRVYAVDIDGVKSRNATKTKRTAEGLRKHRCRGG